jgi:hypothetical protein
VMTTAPAAPSHRQIPAPSGKLADLSREVSREEVCASAQLGWLARFTPLK